MPQSKIIRDCDRRVGHVKGFNTMIVSIIVPHLGLGVNVVEASLAIDKG